MNKTIKLRLTKIAAKTCDVYCSNYGCLLATSLIRRFPGTTVVARDASVTIDKLHYRLSKADSDKVFLAYDRGCSQPISVDKFQPFTIELIPV